MSGFEVGVRVARLSLELSAEGVESLERSIARTAAGYDVEVDLAGRTTVVPAPAP